MKLIQLSDLHLDVNKRDSGGSDGAQLSGGPERLELAIADINRHHGDAAAVVITGDLADHGDTATYQQLQQSLEKLSVDYRLLIGNHDNRQTFLECFPETPTDDNGFVQSVLETEQGTLVLLDTYEPGTHAGHLCAARLAWLESVFSSARAPFFVFMHHPPCDVGLAPLDQLKLMHPEQYTPLFKQHAAQIRHIFFGHIHRPMGGSWLTIPVSAAPSMNFQVALDFQAAGDAIGLSIENAAYKIILIEKDTLVVHFRDFSQSIQTE